MVVGAVNEDLVCLTGDENVVGRKRLNHGKSLERMLYASAASTRRIPLRSTVGSGETADIIVSPLLGVRSAEVTQSGISGSVDDGSFVIVADTETVVGEAGAQPPSVDDGAGTPYLRCWAQFVGEGSGQQCHSSDITCSEALEVSSGVMMAEG